ncbi:MAG: hypothetical protein WD648_05345 [Planctomycetaceae bacterium]
MSNQLTQFADTIAAGAGVKRKKSFSAPVRLRCRSDADFPPEFITLCDFKIFFRSAGRCEQRVDCRALYVWKLSGDR